MHKKVITLAIFLLLGLVNISRASGLYAEKFENNLNNWSFVDLTKVESPSEWSIKNKALYQLSNIGEVQLVNKNLNFLGTMAIFRKFYGSTFDLSFDFFNRDNDTVGLVVGYVDAKNYYQFIINNQRQASYLFQVKNGVSTLVQKTDDYYTVNKLHYIKVQSAKNVLKIYLNKKLIIATEFSQAGNIGLVSVENSGVYFDNFELSNYITTVVNKNNGVGQEKLFRASKDNVIYAIKNGKKHKILNPEVFNSYGYDWNEIITLSLKELDQYPTAHLVKTDKSSNIYYINETLNKKKLIPNADIFAIYNNKMEDVVVVSQKDLDSYENIRLIKKENDSTVYQLISGTKKAISDPREFEALGFQWNEILTIKDAELNYYPNRVKVAGNEVVVAGVEFDAEDLSKEELATSVVNANKYLSVKTIKTKQEQIVPTGIFAPLLEVQLTSGILEPVVINSLTIKNKETFSLLSELFITDIAGKVLGSGKFDSERKVKIVFKNELFVPLNSAIKIFVNTNLDEKGYNYYAQLEIVSASAIETLAFISGEFPLVGDRYKVVPGEKLIGKIEVTSQDVSTGIQSARIGAKKILINKFLFKETTGNEDVYLKKLTVYYNGSDYVELEKVQIIDQSGKVVATVNNPKEREITFDLGKVPYIFKKDSSATFSLLVDIKGGAGGTLKFLINKPADMVLASSKFGYDLFVANSDNFPIGRGTGYLANTLKVNDANVLVLKNKLSPTKDLIANSKHNVLGAFDLKAEGLDLSLEQIVLKINHVGTVGLDDYITIREKSSKKQLANFSASLIDNKSLSISLDTFPLIKNGGVYTFEVLGDISKNATILDTYQVEINTTELRDNVGKLTYHFNYQAQSNIISVQKTHLTIVRNPLFVDNKIATGKLNVSIGSFIMRANIAEDLVVSSFTLVENFGSDKLLNTFHFSNLRVYVNNNLYANFNNLNSGPFLVDKPFTIKAGGTANISVKVDTSPLSEAKNVQLSINSVSAEGKISGLIANQTEYNTSSAIVTFVKSRLLVEKNNAMSDVVITANNNSQRIASFKLTNEGIEKITVNSFTLIESASSDEVSLGNGYTALNSTRGGGVSNPIAHGNRFKNFTIPAGATIILDISVKPSLITAGDQFSLTLKDIISDTILEVVGDVVEGQNIRVVAP